MRTTENYHTSTAAEASDLCGGGRVAVARNLHMASPSGGAIWSLRVRNSVVGYAEHVVLRDAQMRVRDYGRRQARESGQRNVHAFVVGEIISQMPEGKWVRATYNPWKADTFTAGSSHKPIFSAPFARFDSEGMFVMFADDHT